ncbi:2-oxoglutarate dehydrogenase, E2 component, dihydrolipoamide succinyltransferase [Brachybacterium sp. p3-SID1565]|uniref:2-oxoglutarate dehydrogenase, E2 component, dihydrolipoamide succinyltransferase n=1 Tax=Brachybacterium sp. p3-SID1565 TaxID=2916046 RepID=UPI0021A6D537|nr:2-oxoglutarate dehydrogenase, E2 component, dihydrolipoamide succinyltransferase [Brachybacterium sp. p3-SID1565]MCT1386250.1 2-oxoglutarate dehydrogenase, E2 component, dihydrolipoamide succinyltransferase [Brachybacterium sp. p3-SID1565]
MSETVKMPALGESVTEGTVTRWLKSVGDTVEVDEPLLEVSTDKVDTEIPSPVAGTIEKILVEEDEDAEVGADLVVIGDGSGSDDSGSSDNGASDEESESSEGEDLASDETVAPSTSQETPAGEDEKPADKEPDSSDSGSSGEAGKKASGGAASGQEVTMPALGESVTEGTVTRWLKSVGDTVEVDEPLLEVSTDKVDTEIPSPVAGTLLEIRVEEDSDAEVGAVLAIVGDASAASSEEPADDAPKAEEKPEPSEEKKAEEKPEPKAEEKKSEPAEDKTEAPKGEEKQDPSAPASAPKAADSVSGAEGSGYVTPLVRKMASEAGIDLSSVKGTGLGGRIRKQDVQEAIDAAEQAASAPAATQQAAPAAQAPKQAPKVEVSPLRGTEEKMSRIRKITAKRMVESLQTQAQLTTAVEVDMTRVAKLRGAAKDAFAQREGAKLTFLPFIMMAAVEALKTYPKINAEIDGDMIKYNASENIGMAADTDRGLVVPVIKNAGDLNLAGLARQIGELGGKAKNNKLGPDDLSGATFTITNTGSGGALFDTPIVPNPQVGILGCGTIVKRPAVVQNAEGDDSIAIRSMMYLFLSYDHRLVDGGDAARFLTHMKKRLEDGAFEAELGL